MTPEQVDAHDKPAALLRPLSVRRLVALLRPIPGRERAAILAQAVHEGIITRIEVDQVLFALALASRQGRQGVGDGEGCEEKKAAPGEGSGSRCR